MAIVKSKKNNEKFHFHGIKKTIKRTFGGVADEMRILIFFLTNNVNIVKNLFFKIELLR